MLVVMMLVFCGGIKDVGKIDQVLIGKFDIKIEGKWMIFEVFWVMGCIGGLVVLFDGK